VADAQRVPLVGTRSLSVAAGLCMIAASSATKVD
jgi:hypothetical protein